MLDLARPEGSRSRLRNDPAGTADIDDQEGLHEERHPHKSRPHRQSPEETRSEALVKTIVRRSQRPPRTGRRGKAPDRSPAASRRAALCGLRRSTRIPPVPAVGENSRAVAMLIAPLSNLDMRLLKTAPEWACLGRQDRLGGWSE